MDLDLSIVVPCHGRATLTRKLLRSLARCPDRFEVVVVDDGSPAPLEPVVVEFRDRLQLRHLRHRRSLGPAAARNRGVDLASHDLVAFTDNDCEVHRLWPRHLHTYLRDAPGSVAGVGGRVLAAGDDLFSRYYSYHKILDPFPLQGQILYLVTANAAFRRDAFLEVGGFDELLTRPGGEDPGLCFKLLSRGHQLHFYHEAVVFHHYRAGIIDFVRTFFRYGQGCRTQTDRHARDLLDAGNWPSYHERR